MKAAYSAPVENMLIEYLEVRGPLQPRPLHTAREPRPHPRLRRFGKYDDACIRQIVETFARRAFRRPSSPAETEKYTKIALAAKQDGESPEQAIRYALQGILVSPHFLFRIERDTKPGVTHPVTNYELASRLSYFLWSSIPDDALLAAAQRGAVQRETARMIADPKFSSFIENFTGQWLELRNLDEVKPTPKIPPIRPGPPRSHEEGDPTLLRSTHP